MKGGTSASWLDCELQLVLPVLSPAQAAGSDSLVLSQVERSMEGLESQPQAAL